MELYLCPCDYNSDTGVNSYYVFEWLKLFCQNKIKDKIYFSLDLSKSIDDQKEEQMNLYESWSDEELRFSRIGQVFKKADIYLI